MNFGKALESLKEGMRITRKGWNGKGMYLFLVKGEAVKTAIYERYQGKGEQREVLDAIYMFTAQGTLVPWLASQTDVLAEDWLVL